MSHDTAPASEIDRIPHLVLIEGVDYIGTHELHARIMSEVEALSADPEKALICGYDESVGGAEHRTTIFAMTPTEAQQNINDDLERPPYEYAEEALLLGNKAVVAVYNIDCFTSDGIQYTIRPGLDLVEATLLTAELVEQ